MREARLPLSLLLFNIFMDFLTRKVNKACEAKGVHRYKVLVNSPSADLLSMLMLLYANDLVLLAPNSSDLKTALEELERVARMWCMAVNYPNTEAALGLPAAAAATIQVGSNNMAVKPRVCG